MPGIVSNMGTRKVEQGEVGRRVAAQVRVFREARDLSLATLSGRLADYGRPILPSGLNKIEQGHRRVDVDDLVALAASLEITPSQLLDPPPANTDPASGMSSGSVTLTGAASGRANDVVDHAPLTDSITVERSTSWKVEADPLLALNNSLRKRLDETLELLQEMRGLALEQQRLTPAIALRSTSTLSVTGSTEATANANNGE